MATLRCLPLFLLVGLTALVLLGVYTRIGGFGHWSEDLEGQTGNELENIRDHPHKVMKTRMSKTPPTQKEVAVMLMWETYKCSSGLERAEVLEEIKKTMFERAQEDMKVMTIAVLLFGSEEAQTIVHAKRDHRFDDVACVESKIKIFYVHCGMFSPYGMNHVVLAFANMCDRMVEREAFEQACVDTCGFKNITVGPDPAGYLEELMSEDDSYELSSTSLSVWNMASTLLSISIYSAICYNILSCIWSSKGTRRVRFHRRVRKIHSNRRKGN